MGPKKGSNQKKQKAQKAGSSGSNNKAVLYCCIGGFIILGLWAILVTRKSASGVFHLRGDSSIQSKSLGSIAQVESLEKLLFGESGVKSNDFVSVTNHEGEPVYTELTNPNGRVDAVYPVQAREEAPKAVAPIAPPKPVAENINDKNKPQNVHPQNSGSSISNLVHEESISWADFLEVRYISGGKRFGNFESLGLIQCPAKIIDALQKPGLSKEDYDWCEWALSPNGGKVQVGKSYGALKKEQRTKYENLNCNVVAAKKNPSCDDVWGDKSLRTWMANPVPNLCHRNANSKGSNINCIESSSNARFCTFSNAMLDFTKMHTVNRPGNTPSRSWDKGFISTECSVKGDIDYYPFYEALSDPSNEKCDVYIDGNVIAYGHDDIKNLGHTMSDYMNVWTMTWLAKVEPNNTVFFNIDAIRQGNNYNDELGAFKGHYEKSFNSILLARDYDGQKVCIKNLIFMPKPVILFTWDGWWTDMPCTFLGPSSLFQRWNLLIRQSYGLLTDSMFARMSTTWNILIVLRRMPKHKHGRAVSNEELYTSRLFTNENDIIQAAKSIPNAIVTAIDLGDISFEKQIELMASTSIVVGAHGAGITSSMHMPVGTKLCCGVLEYYPQGEFVPIRGHGNMIRRMGIYYDRIDMPGSPEYGMKVNTDQMVSILKGLVFKIEQQSSCFHSDVISNPYFNDL